MDEQTFVATDREDEAAATVQQTAVPESTPDTEISLSDLPETAPETPASTPEDTIPEPQEPTADPPDITHRLAAEFIGMQHEVPGLHTPEDLPPEVWNTAAREGIPLMDAFLRFRWQEEQRIRKEEERRRRAAECSSGSLREGRTEIRPEQEAFMRSFRRALR